MLSHNGAGNRKEAYVSSSSPGGGTWVVVCRLRSYFVLNASFYHKILERENYILTCDERGA